MSSGFKSDYWFQVQSCFVFLGVGDVFVCVCFVVVVDVFVCVCFVVVIIIIIMKKHISVQGRVKRVFKAKL